MVFFYILFSLFSFWTLFFFHSFYTRTKFVRANICCSKNCEEHALAMYNKMCRKVLTIEQLIKTTKILGYMHVTLCRRHNRVASLPGLPIPRYTIIIYWMTVKEIECVLFVCSSSQYNVYLGSLARHESSVSNWKDRFFWGDQNEHCSIFPFEFR